MLSAMSIAQLHAARIIVAEAIENGTSIGTLLQQLDVRLGAAVAEKIGGIEIQPQRSVKATGQVVCPSCGRENLRPLAAFEGLARIGCRCGYSTVMR